MQGKRPSRAWLLTITKRKSRYCEIERLDNRKSQLVKEKTLKALEKYGEEKLLSITRDNGKKFALFNSAFETELNVMCNVSHAYVSHERGTNEYTNGMVRVFYPKWTDFEKVTSEDIENMKSKLNRKPRKILGYKKSLRSFIPKEN